MRGIFSGYRARAIYSPCVSDYLAVDLGAESGRVMLGRIGGGRLSLEELRRFPNGGIALPGGLYWDALRLYAEILEGLRIAGRERRLRPKSIAIDAWGVDFAFLMRDGSLAANPRHYRDTRNQGMVERLAEAVPRAGIFEATGIQFMHINSLCQWYAAKLHGDPVLGQAKTLLFIPDLMNYWLTGVAAAEVTIASTSQFYDPRAKDWARPLLGQLGLDHSLLPPLAQPGTRLGALRPEVADYTGLAGVEVFTTASHDTAAAVAAVPASGEDWCYISSGTWSLMGVELSAPLINERVLAENFTNEAGFGGTTRLLKNIAGLWVLQECRRDWALEGHAFSYGELTAMAAEEAPYAGYIPPDEFSQPGQMPRQIAAYCRHTGQPVPATPAAMTRAILEGLARRYAEALATLEDLTGRRIAVIHIVGGGSKNNLLNALVERQTGRRVVAGPAEAAATGNVLVQAIGTGEVADLAAARRLTASALAGSQS